MAGKTEERELNVVQRRPSSQAEWGHLVLGRWGAAGLPPGLHPALSVLPFSDRKPHSRHCGPTDQ